MFTKWIPPKLLVCPTSDGEIDMLKAERDALLADIKEAEELKAHGLTPKAVVSWKLKAEKLETENARLRAEIESLMLECGYKPEFIEAALKTED